MVSLMENQIPPKRAPHVRFRHKKSVCLPLREKARLDEQAGKLGISPAHLAELFILDGLTRMWTFEDVERAKKLVQPYLAKSEGS